MTVCEEQLHFEAYLTLYRPGIQVENSILLTANLTTGSYVAVYPLTGAAVPKLPLGIPSFSHVKQASAVRLQEIMDGPSNIATRISSANSYVKNSKKCKDWLYLLLREMLVDLRYITASQILCVSYEGLQRRFTISSVSLARGNKLESERADEHLAQGMNELTIDTSTPHKHKRPDIWVVDWDTAVSIVPYKPKLEQTTERLQALHGSRPEIECLPHRSESDAYASVGGLQKQIQEIRDLIELPLTRPDLFEHFGLKPPRGILLHGPPGTGKTHLARAIAASTRSSVLVINGPELSSAYHGETESKLRAVFREANRRSPCIVILDEVDALAPRRDEGGVGLGAGGDRNSGGGGGEVERRVVATLLTILDGMESGRDLDDGNESEEEKYDIEPSEDEERGGQSAKGRVVVIGTTNRPNAIDPALRRPGRFDKEIEIGVPDADARLDILNVLLANMPHNVTQDELRAFSSRAHGYVGADLNALVREAGTSAIKRWLASESQSSTLQRSRSADATLMFTLADLSASLSSVRPSALRSLFAELPPIRYADIGGQSHVIQKLRETVEWPLLHPDAFKRLGIRPPKGWFELFGGERTRRESERAVREIFRKAKAASPSIIFFDEIDALAASRASGSDNVTHEGVITSLLNEMDGVQELQGVTIIAATNRPEIIDSALMRPGRFDRTLYIGLPDQVGREEILKIRTRTMTIDPDTDIAEIARLSEGCSGAEITALCQEAAILTMQRDINAPFVPHEAFVHVARMMKRQISSAVLEKFDRWRERVNH
ncbi:hypothetical protein APHAL10511_003370 [Amanita phalloides]|nr:hypothetical protein APHAL10511_003370 [Amanita phalloides]